MGGRREELPHEKPFQMKGPLCALLTSSLTFPELACCSHTGHLLCPQGHPPSVLCLGVGAHAISHQPAPGQSSCHSLLPPPCLCPSRPAVVNQGERRPPGGTWQCQTCLVVVTVVGVFPAPGAEPRDAAQRHTMNLESSSPRSPAWRLEAPPRTQCPLTWPASLVTCLPSKAGDCTQQVLSKVRAG